MVGWFHTLHFSLSYLLCMTPVEIAADGRLDFSSGEMLRSHRPRPRLLDNFALVRIPLDLVIRKSGFFLHLFHHLWPIAFSFLSFGLKNSDACTSFSLHVHLRPRLLLLEGLVRHHLPRYVASSHQHLLRIVVSWRVLVELLLLLWSSVHLLLLLLL